MKSFIMSCREILNVDFGFNFYGVGEGFIFAMKDREPKRKTEFM